MSWNTFMIPAAVHKILWVTTKKQMIKIKSRKYQISSCVSSKASIYLSLSRKNETKDYRCRAYVTRLIWSEQFLFTWIPYQTSNRFCKRINIQYKTRMKQFVFWITLRINPHYRLLWPETCPRYEYIMYSSTSSTCRY